MGTQKTKNQINVAVRFRCNERLVKYLTRITWSIWVEDGLCSHSDVHWLKQVTTTKNPRNIRGFFFYIKMNSLDYFSSPFS
jgi:hypothetical protein